MIGRSPALLFFGLLGLAANLSQGRAAALQFPAARRAIAPIVSPTWGDAAARDRAREVEQIAARLRIKPGMTVADIGAGSGYDALRLARLLGPNGRVVAEDVTPKYLQLLTKALAGGHIRNVVVALGEPGDPHLQARSIDRAVMIHMYHEISEPYALLAHLAGAFKPHGLLGVEELDRPTAFHGTPPMLLRCELETVGYRLVGIHNLDGGLGYFAVFAPPKTPRIVGAPARCAGKPT